jgi:hypothetical protein
MVGGRAQKHLSQASRMIKLFSDVYEISVHDR